MEGTVKWFNPSKGYGFIVGEDGTDYFAHFGEIQSEGFKTLKEGQSVTFEEADGEKGPVAKNIMPASDMEATAEEAEETAEEPEAEETVEEPEAEETAEEPEAEETVEEPEAEETAEEPEVEETAEEPEAEDNKQETEN
jgi:CspA family cold shock protein